ncbi:MAG: hypothetical protein ACRC3Y_05435 [Romboutsia sp.]|uniref:hypothetical protein n=1 Tax=Romboutsia sp. TaxID=1965302 RepID=UPI003F402EDB
MKKIILLVCVMLLSLNIAGCSTVETSPESYQIKKEQELKVGEDIPAGKYILKSDATSIAYNINNIDGSTAVSEFLSTDNGESIEYEVELSEKTIISTSEDAILIKK